MSLQHRVLEQWKEKLVTAAQDVRTVEWYVTVAQNVYNSTQ